MLTIAPYCDEESKSAGATPAQIKAGIALVEEAMNDIIRVDVDEIEVTKGTQYRSWHRLRLKNAPPSSYRAIIEITPTEVILHVVLPRMNDTYDEVERLWQQHRSIP